MKGLPTGGKKADLVKRLEEANASERDEGSADAASGAAAQPAKASRRRRALRAMSDCSESEEVERPAAPLAGQKRRRLPVAARGRSSAVARDAADSASEDEVGAGALSVADDGDADDDDDDDDDDSVSSDQEDGDDAMFFTLEKVPQYLVYDLNACVLSGKFGKPAATNLITKTRKTIDDIIALCAHRIPAVPAHAAKWVEMRASFDRAINSDDPPVEIGKLLPFILTRT